MVIRRHTQFVAITAGSLLLWVRHLLVGMFSSVYDGYEWLAVLVLVHTILASHSMPPKRSLPLEYVV